MNIVSHSRSRRLLAVIAGTIALVALVAIALPLGHGRGPTAPPESPNAVPHVGLYLMVGIAGVGLAAMLLLVIKEITDRA